jgi:flavin prenyltransferase
LLKEERDLPGEPRKLAEALASRYALKLREGQVTPHAYQDLGAPLASGSYLVHGMAIVPASMRTVAALAAGLELTLVDRAAAVTLKERRPLVVMPRETPFTRIQIENLLRLHDAGAVILPAEPAFYQHPRTLEDLADFMVARVLEHLGLRPQQDLVPRWGSRE